MSAVTVTQMASRAGDLLRARLGIRGETLEAQVARAGRRLPKRVRAAASELATAAVMVQNPKLQVQVDEERVALAYDTVVRHLGGVNPRARGRGLWASVAASAAFSVLAVGALVFAYLVWRGYV
jgi:hypothetical protein